MFEADGVTPNEAARARVARRFYETHGDNYDFLVVFTNFEFSTPGLLAFFNPVRNDVSGIGLPPADRGALYGSPGRLKGYVDMAAVERYRALPQSLEPGTHGFLRTLGVLSHEVGHQWLAQPRYRNSSGQLSPDLLGRAGSHWSYLLDSDASVMHGSDWTSNGNGTFTAARTWDGYSPLDLYLMGLLDPARVDPFTLLRNPAVDPTGAPNEGATVSAVPETVTVGQVIAAEGPRAPSHVLSPKDFRLGFIVLTAPGTEPSAEDLEAVERVRSAFAGHFFALTRGVAVADTTLAEEPPSPTLGHAGPGPRAGLARGPAVVGRTLGGRPRHRTARHGRGRRDPRLDRSQHFRAGSGPDVAERRRRAQHRLPRPPRAGAGALPLPRPADRPGRRDPGRSDEQRGLRAGTRLRGRRSRHRARAPGAGQPGPSRGRPRAARLQRAAGPASPVRRLGGGRGSRGVHAGDRAGAAGRPRLAGGPAGAVPAGSGAGGAAGTAEPRRRLRREPQHGLRDRAGGGRAFVRRPRARARRRHRLAAPHPAPGRKLGRQPLPDRARDRCLARALRRQPGGARLQPRPRPSRARGGADRPRHRARPQRRERRGRGAAHAPLRRRPVAGPRGRRDDRGAARPRRGGRGRLRLPDRRTGRHAHALRGGRRPARGPRVARGRQRRLPRAAGLRTAPRPRDHAARHRGHPVPAGGGRAPRRSRSPSATAASVPRHRSSCRSSAGTQGSPAGRWARPRCPPWPRAARRW